MYEKIRLYVNEVGHYRVTLCLCLKTSHCDLHEHEAAYIFNTCEKFRTKTRFDTEAKGSSEMAYCTHILAKARGGVENSVSSLCFFPFMNEESRGECFFQVVLMISLHIAAFVMSLKRREFGCQGLINVQCPQK